MKKHCFYLLLCLLATGLFSACSSDDNNDTPDSGQPPVATIRNLSDRNTCAVGENLHFKADNSADGITFAWMVDGARAGEGDTFTFQASAEGRFELVLQATNLYGTDADTLRLTVTAPEPPADGDFFITRDILNWTGEGENLSALAIQWVKGKANDQPADEDIVFLAWGYRWNTAATGMDMLKAIAKNDPRLFVIVSEGSMPAVNGFGYDFDNDGHIEVKNGSLTLTEADFTDGIYTARTGEDYDSMAPTGNDLWMGGWMKGYASYYVADSSDQVPDVFKYSGVGFAQRTLKHLSWDAWTFSSINSDAVNVKPRPDLLSAASPNR